MADEHSEPGGMKVLRLYADALGESRFETTTMPMALKEFAPPAAPLCVSDPQPAQNYVILEVGSASFFTPGLGNLNPGSVCGGLPCGDVAGNGWIEGQCAATKEETATGGGLRILRAGRDWHWKRRVFFQSGAGFSAEASYRIRLCYSEPCSPSCGTAAVCGRLGHCDVYRAAQENNGRPPGVIQKSGSAHADLRRTGPVACTMPG